MIAENKQDYFNFLSKEYDNVMSIPLVERAKFCNCYMCCDPNSATCLEVYYFLKGYSVTDCEEAILKLKRNNCLCSVCTNCINHEFFIRDNLWYYKMCHDNKYDLVINELSKKI